MTEARTTRAVKPNGAADIVAFPSPQVDAGIAKAVADPGAGAKDMLLDIEAWAVKPSATNPRKSYDRAALDELKASICSETGLLSKLLVRPVFAEGDGSAHPLIDHYELVAGARRHIVLLELGWKTLPCIVRTMSDAEVREAQIVENLQRAGVDPLEEAEAFAELLGRLGSVAAVAARLGKEQSYVAKCLRLQSLTLHSSDALRGRLITIDHALLLARLAETEQNAALKWALDTQAGSKTPVEKVVEERQARRVREEKDKEGFSSRRYVWEPESVVQLKMHIEGGSGVKLSRAPWSLDADRLLPGVVACAECPKNTKANAPLFSDLAIDDPTCTDGACFGAKVQAFVQIAQLAAGHDDAAKPKILVPRLSWKISSVKPSVVPNDLRVIIETPGRCGETANPVKLLRYGQWIDAKKGSCPNVRPGITADWSDSGERGYGSSGKKLRMPGETVLVCIAVGCKVHPKGWEKAKSGGAASNGSSERVASPEEIAAREAFVKAEREMREEIYRAISRKVEAELRKLSHSNSAAMRILYPVIDDAIPWDDDDYARVCGLLAVPATSDKSLELHAKAAVLPSLLLMLFHLKHSYAMDVGGLYEQRDPKAARKRLMDLAYEFGAGSEAAAILAQHTKPAKAIAAPAAKKAAKKAPAKPVAKKAAKKLSAEHRKEIAANMQKRWAERRKAASK